LIGIEQIVSIKNLERTASDPVRKMSGWTNVQNLLLAFTL